MSDDHLSDQFKKLTRDVQKLLDKNMGKTRTKARLDQLQKEQVELLMKLEKEFRNSIIKKSPMCSKEVYQRFMVMITVENQNILTARPYFREQAANFSKNVTPALKTGDYKKLQKAHPNFNFIKFVREYWKGSLPKESEDLYNLIEKTRRELIENNLPLAISRAVQFDEKTPNSSKERMDLINSACMGLISGIDKYSAEEYTKVFRSVCIGRMSGNMVDTYSETSLHFYPSDKKILYKANTLRHRLNIEEMPELLDAINEDFGADAKKKGQKYVPVKLEQLYDLMNAQSTVSADATTDEEGMNVYSYTADNKENVERKVVNHDSLKEVRKACDNLDIIERKILRLKGMSI